jgi:hypothetical protein
MSGLSPNVQRPPAFGWDVGLLPKVTGRSVLGDVDPAAFPNPFA